VAGSLPPTAEKRQVPGGPEIASAVTASRAEGRPGRERRRSRRLRSLLLAPEERFPAHGPAERRKSWPPTPGAATTAWNRQRKLSPHRPRAGRGSSRMAAEVVHSHCQSRGGAASRGRFPARRGVTAAHARRRAHGERRPRGGRSHCRRRAEKRILAAIEIPEEKSLPPGLTSERHGHEKTRSLVPLLRRGGSAARRASRSALVAAVRGGGWKEGYNPPSAALLPGAGGGGYQASMIRPYCRVRA